MQNITFEPATRTEQKVLLSLVGKTTAGKTFSALTLARGLVGPTGRIAVADTERGRASQYADKFTFDRADITPPYHPNVFINALDHAEKARYDCLIFDSGSHEWSGTGGVKYLASNAGTTNQIAKWNKPKEFHKAFMDRVTASPIHIIFCLRGNKKIVEFWNEQKQKKDYAETADLIPDQEKDFLYEMTFNANLDDDHLATWTKLPDDLAGILPNKEMITEKHGAFIREWASSARDEIDFKKLMDNATAAANRGLSAYRLFFEKLSDRSQNLLITNDHHENLKVTAARVSAANNGRADPSETLPHIPGKGAEN